MLKYKISEGYLKGFPQLTIPQLQISMTCGRIERKIWFVLTMQVKHPAAGCRGMKMESMEGRGDARWYRRAYRYGTVQAGIY